MVMSLRKKSGYRADANGISPYYSSSTPALQSAPVQQVSPALQSAPVQQVSPALQSALAFQSVQAPQSVPIQQSAPAFQDWSQPWAYSRESAAALYNNPGSLGLPSTPGVPGSLFFANGVVMKVGTRTSVGLGGGSYTGPWGNPDGPGAIGNARSDANADYGGWQNAMDSRRRAPDAFGANGGMLTRDQIIENRNATKAGLPLPHALYDLNTPYRARDLSYRYPVGSLSHAAYLDDTDGTPSDYSIASDQAWRARHPMKDNTARPEDPNESAELRRFRTLGTYYS